MAFIKGKSGNVNGRPKGSKDKAKTNIKETFQLLVEGNLSNIQEWLNVVANDNPTAALNFVLKLSEFIIPKIKVAEFKPEINAPSQVDSIEGIIKFMSEHETPEAKEERYSRIAQMLIAHKSSI